MKIENLKPEKLLGLSSTLFFFFLLLCLDMGSRVVTENQFFLCDL